MIVIMFRILLLMALVILFYTILQYLKNPQRRLEIAKSSNDFYFVDEANNSKTARFHTITINSNICCFCSTKPKIKQKFDVKKVEKEFNKDDNGTDFYEIITSTGFCECCNKKIKKSFIFSDMDNNFIYFIFFLILLWLIVRYLSFFNLI